MPNFLQYLSLLKNKKNNNNNFEFPRVPKEQQ